MSWIKINDKIDLLDSPGVLWPKIDEEEVALNLSAFTSIKEEILNLDRIAIHILEKLNTNYKDILYDLYGIKEFNLEEIEQIYFDIAKKRSINTNNDDFYDKVNMIILNDIKQEKLKGITFDKM